MRLYIRRGGTYERASKTKDKDTDRHMYVYKYIYIYIYIYICISATIEISEAGEREVNIPLVIRLDTRDKKGGEGEGVQLEVSTNVLTKSQYTADHEAVQKGGRNV